MSAISQKLIRRIKFPTIDWAEYDPFESQQRGGSGHHRTIFRSAGSGAAFTQEKSPQRAEKEAKEEEEN